jgi:hypothetical protein
MTRSLIILVTLICSLFSSNVVYAMEGMSSPNHPTIKLSIHRIEDKGDQKLVKIKLTKLSDNQPVTLNDLKEVHTQKIHLLIIDSGLQDYIHIHPKPANEPGIYEFLWKPKTKNNYRIWADLVPVIGGKQEFAMADLIKDNKTKTTIDKTVSFNTTADGMNFKLSFYTDKLKVGKASMGKILVTDSKGNPVKDLQVLMGAFAHIVCFGEDYKSIIHIHPMGAEPTDVNALGGPEVEFHIEPMHAGFIKLFAQVLVKGKEIYAPFGLMVYE